jgi:3',5'-cyclic AMP phosphodiesterase CpdA
LKHLEARAEGTIREPLPDIIIVTGDLTSYAAEVEFNTVKDALRKMIRIVNGKKPCWRKPNQPALFLVPGNHDLDWAKPTHADKIERYSRMCVDLGAGQIVSAVYPPGSNGVARFFDFGDDCNLLIYLLDSSVLGGVENDQIKALSARYRQLFQRLGYHAKPGGDGTDFERALRELDELSRQDPGYVDLESLEQVEKDLHEADVPPDRFKIVAMHHNPSGIPSEDVEAFDTIVNAGLAKNALVKAGFDVLLHGHRHTCHGSYEEYLVDQSQDNGEDTRENFPYRQGLFVLGGDSLGAKQAG